MSCVTIKEFTDTIIEIDRLQIIKDFEQFELDGKIGDCVLRCAASNYKLKNPAFNCSISLTMGLIANEVFRYYAMLYLKDK